MNAPVPGPSSITGPPLGTMSLLLTQYAQANKWEKIGPLYFDFDSVTRVGNVVSITIAQSMNSAYGTMMIDCVEKTAEVKGWQTISIERTPSLKPVADRVCKRPWELWK